MSMQWSRAMMTKVLVGGDKQECESLKPAEQ